MNITKESLHTLIDIVDTREYDILYRLLMKFLPVDEPTDDEIEALAIADQEIENGEVYTLDEIE